MKRCSKCILPGSYPGIVFDNNGVCNRCHEWLNEYQKVNYPQLREQLDELIEQQKEKARQHGLPYDVIVPVSGGKDSAYALYVMKEVYKCRVLAVNFNNTFQTEVAYQNLLNLSDVFDVDFRMVAIKPGLLKKAYAESMKRLGEFCLVCNCTGYWLMLSFFSDLFSAYDYTPMIIGGWSKLYEFDPQINTLNFSRYRQLLDEAGLLPAFSENLHVEILDSLSGNQDVRQQKSGGFIQLPDYWPWNHQEILKTLEEKGWKKLEDKDTHFDCWASPLADQLEKMKYGLNQKTTVLTAYVRAGLLDRDEALKSDEFSVNDVIDNALIQKFSSHIGLNAKLLNPLKTAR